MAGAVKAAAFAAFVRVFVLTFPNYVNDWRPSSGCWPSCPCCSARCWPSCRPTSSARWPTRRSTTPGSSCWPSPRPTPTGTAAVLFYVAAYTFMVAGSFARGRRGGRQGRRTHDASTTTGACPARTRCWPASLTVFLLAQAGIPFTAGFFAKFWPSTRCSDNHVYWLAIVAMLSSAIAAFLYLRIVVFMYLGDQDEAPAEPHIRVPFGHQGGDQPVPAGHHRRRDRARTVRRTRRPRRAVPGRAPGAHGRAGGQVVVAPAAPGRSDGGDFMTPARLH